MCFGVCDGEMFEYKGERVARGERVWARLQEEWYRGG